MNSAVIEGRLGRRDTAPCEPVAFEGRWLDADDVPAVIELHHDVREAVAADLLCRETDRFFIDHVGRCGRILGLFAEDRLIAYGVLGFPSPNEESFADGFGLTVAERASVATIDGTSVAPRWRGNGLQKLLIAARLEEARAAGCRIAVSTVAPGNLPSLHNLLSSAMTVRALRHVFGGLRFLVRCDLDVPIPAPPLEGRWIATTDTDSAAAALDAGGIGWTFEEAADGSRIWYG